MGRTVNYLGGEIPLWLRKNFCFLDATFSFANFNEAAPEVVRSDLLVTSSEWLSYSTNLETLRGGAANSVMLDLKRETDLSLLKEVFVVDLVREEMSNLECVTRLSKYTDTRTGDAVGEGKEVLTKLHKLGLVGKEAEVAAHLLKGALRGGVVPAQRSSELLMAVWQEEGESSKVKYVMRRINSRLTELDIPVRVVNQRGVGWSFKDGDLLNYLPQERGTAGLVAVADCEECLFGYIGNKTREQKEKVAGV